jgi:hypothetical protein
MSHLRMLRAGWLCALLAPLGGMAQADEYSFDTSAFEKKPFELGGYVELKQEAFGFNRSGIFYQINNTGLPQRETLDRTTATMQLSGKLRYGVATFDFRTSSMQQHDQWANGHDNSIYEAAWSIRPDPGVTVEAGKRSLKWGKGYAWNPIGFVERPKDPNDPQLAREGFMLADGDLIINRSGALQTVALTPVLLPTTGGLNKDFGASGHINPAAKLYLLYRDTDIDFAWQGKGSRPARFGIDFSRNLATNIELHGEWARIRQFQQAVTDNSGRTSTRIGDATSYLFGLRYLTASETTFITEYYHNGTGYADQELDQFYRLAGAAFQQLQQTGQDSLWKKIQSLAQAGYGRPNTGRDYAYLRAQVKDAFGVVYFQPAITAMINVNDRSFQITPELQYTGINNLELRARLFLLGGGHATDFGEKQNARKLELYARLYF